MLPGTRTGTLLLAMVACGGKSELTVTEEGETCWRRVEVESQGRRGVLIAAGEFAPVLRADDSFECNDEQPGSMCVVLQAQEGAAFLVRPGDPEQLPMFVPSPPPPAPPYETCQDYFDECEDCV